MGATRVTGAAALRRCSHLDVWPFHGAFAMARPLTSERDGGVQGCLTPQFDLSQGNIIPRATEVEQWEVHSREFKSWLCRLPGAAHRADYSSLQGLVSWWTSHGHTPTAPLPSSSADEGDHVA